MTRSRIALVSACAVSGAAALWLNLAAHPPVVDAARAPALLELVASLAAAARPAVPLGSIFAIWHHAGVALAAAFVAVGVWRLTRSLLAAAAMGLVAAASPLMIPALAPPDVTALAVAAATACAMLGTGAIGAVAGLTLLAAIAPPLILPNAVLCWWVVRAAGPGRDLKAFAAAAVLIIIAGASAMALPPLPGQTTNGVLSAIAHPRFSMSSALTVVSNLLATAGPLALALAAFGLFSIISNEPREPANPDRQLALGLGFPAAGCAAAMFTDAQPIRFLAPLVIALWLLAGLGIAEIASRAGTARRRAAAFVVAAILVAIHVEPRINPPPSAADKPALLGHETLTRRDFQALLYQLPPNSALIADDAVTDALLRSLNSSLLRSRNGIHVVARTPEDLATARSAGRVFALPRAQTDLQDRGVRFVDVAPAVPGIAEVAAVVPCDRLTTSWRTVPSAAGVIRLAFVAGDDAARGPIVIYAGGPAFLESTPIGWPPLALRGFYTRSYDRAKPDRRQGLADEVANDGAPSDHPAVNTANVARTELWRVPGAPRALTFALSAPATDVAATQLARGTGPIQLCPVFPFPVTRFER